VVFDAKLAETDLKEAKKEGKGGKKSKAKKADAADSGADAEQNAEAKAE
jgi:hypothetical protein